MIPTTKLQQNTQKRYNLFLFNNTQSRLHNFNYSGLFFLGIYDDWNTVSFPICVTWSVFLSFSLSLSPCLCHAFSLSHYLSALALLLRYIFIMRQVALVQNSEWHNIRRVSQKRMAYNPLG